MDHLFIGRTTKRQFVGSREKHHAAVERWKRLLCCAQWVAFTMCGTALASPPKFLVNKDPAICNDFASLLRSAAVASMNDDELCTFRFSSLPKNAKGRFSFPEWQKIQMADPAAEALRVYEANALRTQKRTSREIANYVASARMASSEHNLEIYRATVQVQGSSDPTYLEMVDVSHCSKTKVQYQETDGSTIDVPYVYQGFPSLGVFTSPSYTKEIAAESGVFEAQVALYEGKTPVQISIASEWIRIRPEPTLLAELEAYRRMPANKTPYGWVTETLAAHSLCEIELKPTVAKTNVKVKK